MEPGIRKLLRTDAPPMIRGIGGMTMTALGILTVCVKIADHEWPIDMVVQPGDEIVGCLIGFDFFQMYGCALSMKDGCFEIEGIKFQMNAEYKHDMCARVRVEESVIIPPQSELVISGIPDAKIKHFPGVQCSTEPAYYAQELTSDGLSVGGSLFFNGTKHIPVPIVNPTMRPVHILKGRTIAIALPVHHTTDYAQTPFGQNHAEKEPIIAKAPHVSVPSTADTVMQKGAPVLSTVEVSSKQGDRVLHYLANDTDTEDDDSGVGYATAPRVITAFGPDPATCLQAASESQSISARPRSRVATDALPEHLKPLMTGLADDLTEDQRSQIAGLILEYQDIFSSGPDDMGHTDLVQHQIDTGDARPIRLPPRRIPIAKQQIETDEIKRMLDRGVIQPSASAWASPVVLVTKKDGTTRFCIDYRKLNDVTCKDAYPLPRIDDTVGTLAGSTFFSTLDLYSGYWQGAMDPRDREKTAFTTRHGLYEWRVMPPGLCSVLATTERLMELVLHGLSRGPSVWYISMTS
jgi:hypothetical protein